MRTTLTIAAERNARRRELLKKVLRLSAFVLSVWAIVVVVVGARVRAQLGEAMFELGPAMLRYDGAIRQDAPRDLFINGQRIRLASGTTTHDLDTVLATYEARCAASDGGLGDEARALTAGGALPEQGETPIGVLRESSERRGYVACLDLGPTSIGAQGVLERIRRFEQTKDLAAIGDFRYVFAERTETGTHFVALWTQGAFKIEAMFPRSSDAPGRDPVAVPRPAGARRILSSWEDGHPQSLVVYEVRAMRAPNLVDFYRERLPAEGWRWVEHERVARVARTSPILVAERGDSMVTLFVTDAGERGAKAAVVVSRER